MYWLSAGGAIALAGLCALGFIGNVRWQRRVYWASWLFGAVLMACAFIERGWQMVGLVLAVCLTAAVCYAYFRTSYLKLGESIRSGSHEPNLIRTPMAAPNLR